LRPALRPNNSECLEIGAGIGVAGLFAAAFGYEVTITDIDEYALLFARRLASGVVKTNISFLFMKFG